MKNCIFAVNLNDNHSNKFKKVKELTQDKNREILVELRSLGSHDSSNRTDYVRQVSMRKTIPCFFKIIWWLWLCDFGYYWS